MIRLVIEHVLDMIAVQMEKGTDFEKFFYEFEYNHYTCEVVISHFKDRGRFVADIGVDVPETNRMFSMNIVRGNTLETIQEYFMDRENEETIEEIIKILIRRVNEE